MRKKKYELRQNAFWEDTTTRLSDKLKKIVNDKVLNSIKLNPYKSEYLRLELEGLRSYKLRSGNRIIFAICEECRKGGFESANNCLDCKDIPDNTIMLFAFGGHDIYDDISRKRKKLLRKTKKKKKKLRRR